MRHCSQGEKSRTPKVIHRLITTIKAREDVSKRPSGFYNLTKRNGLDKHRYIEPENARKILDFQII